MASVSKFEQNNHLSSIMEMEDELKKIKEDNFELRLQLEKLTKLNSSMKQQYTAVRKELEEVKVEKCHLEKEMIEKSNQIEMEKKEVERISGMFVKARREKDPKVLKEKLNQVTTELQQIQEKYEVTNKENSNLQATVIKLQSEMAESKLELEEKLEKVAEYDVLVSNEREMCQALHSELLRVHNDLEKTKAKLHNKSENVVKCENPKDHEIASELKFQLEENTKQLKNTKATAKGLLSSLNVQLRQQRKEIESLKGTQDNEKAEFEKKLDNMTQEMRHFVNDRDIFVTFVQKVKLYSQFPQMHKYASLENELEKLTAHIRNKFSSVYKFCLEMDSAFQEALTPETKHSLLTLPNLQAEHSPLLQTEKTLSSNGTDIPGTHQFINETLCHQPQLPTPSHEPAQQNLQIKSNTMKKTIPKKNRHREDVTRKSMWKNDSTYFCTCGTAFTSKKKLGAHIRHYKREKKFQCNDCSKRFMFVCQLKRHMKTTHTTLIKQENQDFGSTEQFQVNSSIKDGQVKTSTFGPTDSIASSMLIAPSFPGSGVFIKTEQISDAEMMDDGCETVKNSEFFSFPNPHAVDPSRPECCTCGIPFVNQDRLINHIKIRNARKNV